MATVVTAAAVVVVVMTAMIMMVQLLVVNTIKHKNILFVSLVNLWGIMHLLCIRTLYINYIKFIFVFYFYFCSNFNVSYILLYLYEHCNYPKLCLSPYVSFGTRVQQDIVYEMLLSRR